MGASGSVGAHVASSTGVHPCPACAFTGDLCCPLLTGSGPSPSVPSLGVHGFPVLRRLCPVRCSMRALAFRWGLPSLLPHAPSHPSRSLPCSTWKTHTARDRGRVPLLAPSARCGSPICGQRVEQGDLCPLCHRLRWTWGPTR